MQTEKKPYKDLTEKDLVSLESKIKSKTTMLLLYADWCIHCKMFKPTWTKFAEDTTKKTKKIQFLAINAEVLQSLSSKDKRFYDYITTTPNEKNLYFPKLMVFLKTKKGIVKEEYTEDKKMELLNKYVDNLLLKTVSVSKKAVVTKNEKKPVVAKKKKEPESISIPFPKSKKKSGLIDGAHNLNEQIMGASKKSLPTLIDQMISKYLGL